MNMRDIIPWGRSHQPAPRPFEADPFLSLHREMNRLFDDVFRGFDLPTRIGSAAPFGAGWPKLEIAEDDKQLTIAAEVPGLDENDIEVLLDDGVLTIRGEKTSSTEAKDKQFSEHFYGKFERRIPLDAMVADDQVNASFKNGVLTITLPKVETPPSTAKRIEIRKAS
uniref:Heat shock protein Hsp20 n=1 Tax=Rhodopseudomonas palustris (strain DX-1) TaxID=652103 RepID=E6VGQ5_RHOPX